MIPTGEASDYEIIPSYTTAGGGHWRYVFTNSQHYFATIIPNFTQYNIPSSIEEVVRNGEAYNSKITTGNLEDKEYRYTASDSIGTLEIKDDDYRQYYKFFEASANISQFTNVDIEAEPRLIQKKTTKFGLVIGFMGK